MRFFGSRAARFGLERVVSAGGGFLFAAILVRLHSTEAAAAFFAAWALAALFQPVFANAVAPLAVRLWKDDGAGAFLGLWSAMQAAALAIAAFIAVLSDSWLGVAMTAQIAAAPLALFSAPFVARDRYRELLAVLVPASLFGVAVRTGLLLSGADLVWAAAAMAIEPLTTGAVLARRSGAFRTRPRITGPAAGVLKDGAPWLIAAMAATTLFWRSPVLLADAFLAPAGVVAIALAMQVASGLCLPANALAQSLFGPLAAGRAEAARAAVLVALASGTGAIAALALAGGPALAMVYGPSGLAAAPLALWLAPLAGLAPLWRVDAFTAGLNHRFDGLIRARLTALAGQAGLAWLLWSSPNPVIIAAITPLSMALAIASGPRPDLGALTSPPAFRRSLRLLLQP